MFPGYREFEKALLKYFGGGPEMATESKD